MKKAMCVLLSLLLFAAVSAPAMASEPVAAASEPTILPYAAPIVGLDDLSDGTFTVTFIQPSAEYEEGYAFTVSENGNYRFVLETEHLDDSQWLYNNCYLYDEQNDRYVLANTVFDYYFPNNPVYYTPEKLPETMVLPENTILPFKVATSPKYNLATAIVRANGENLSLNSQKEYTLLVDRDITVRLLERNEYGEEVLLRNYFFVYLPKGEEGEYRCRTLDNTNYKVVFYGDSFDFRLLVDKNSVVSGLTVSVQRGASGLSDELGFDPASYLAQIGIGNLEVLTSYGTDASGARLYRIENIKTNITINVAGVKTQDSSDLMDMLMRILRLICNFFGINLPFLQDRNITHQVMIHNDSGAVNVAYLQGSSVSDLGSTVVSVGNKDNFSLIVYKYSENQNVSVRWTPGNDLGGNYAAVWTPIYDANTDSTYYSAIFNIDNITADTDVYVIVN